MNKISLFLTLFLTIICNFMGISSNGISKVTTEHVEWMASDCSMWVNSLGKTFEINNKKLITCDYASIFWSYPKANLTITFYADLTASKPFLLCLRETDFLYKDIPIYRVTRNQEYVIIVNDDPLCFKSDDDNTVVFRFTVPSNIEYYGELIHFTIY